MGVDMSCIGFREAKLPAPIAFVASRIAARLMVKTLAQHVASAGLATVDVQIRLFDERADAAMEMITCGLDRGTANELLRVAVDKSDAVAAMWDGLFVDEPGGEAMEAALAGPPRPRRPGDGHHLLPDDADGDDEHTDANALPIALAIQKALFRITDTRRNALIRHSMLRRGDLPGVRRLDELLHAECDHTWMRTLSRHKGTPPCARRFHRRFAHPARHRSTLRAASSWMRPGRMLYAVHGLRVRVAITASRACCSTRVLLSTLPLSWRRLASFLERS